jgi:hypothetical protein
MQATDPLPGAALESSEPRAARLRVAGTDGEGLSLRTAPSVDAARLKTVPEGATLVVVGDARQGDGRTWRNVRDAEGSTGWAAADYLRPV